ncbi:IS256 family transposase [Streptomyces sp. NPDC026665]|uniref:IS256 family transposase n=1 Tax=Streptomyces sp. NPDC026665 TaxID=3154798 RepID=UPI0033D97A97
MVDEVVERLLDKAGASGAALLGEGGLLTEIARAVLERALEAEMSEHLGYERGDLAGHGSGNSRNGTSPKTVLTDAGAIALAVPRDRNGDFEPRMVPKNARRLAGFNDRILSLYARGMSVRDIRSHLAQIYGVEVSPDLISKVTDAVVDELVTWQNRPLDAVWPIIYIDALWAKIRSGSVTSKPVYVAVGVDMDGRKDVLGLWVGSEGEGATTWMAVLTELRNRGVEDVLMLVCDGLKGLPDAITATWPRAVVQTSSVHTPWWRESPAGHRASGRGPVQTRCLRDPHTDLSLPLEAGRELASERCASSAEMRYQPGRPVGDLDRQDGTHAHGPLITHQHRRSSQGVRRPRLGKFPSAALRRGRGRPGRASGTLRTHR